MLYFLYGEDTQAVNTKAGSLVASLLKKKPDASFFTVTEENWSENIIEEYLASQGLFENKYIVLIKNIFAEHKERKEDFLKRLEDFAQSPNIFIVAEGSTDKASLKKIEKHAEKVQEFTLDDANDSGSPANQGKNQGKNKGGDFKVFALADALGARDKKALWTLYRSAVEAGKVSEEIHGILFWQVKSMIIASKTKTAAESGLNPFVFGKAKRYAENFSPAELATMLENLVTVYHDSHRGIHEFETALERLTLEL